MAENMRVVIKVIKQKYKMKVIFGELKTSLKK